MLLFKLGVIWWKDKKNRVVEKKRFLDFFCSYDGNFRFGYIGEVVFIVFYFCMFIKIFLKYVIYILIDDDVCI